MVNDAPSPFSRYGVALLIVAVALALTWMLFWPSLASSTFSLFFAAVMLSTWYGGLGPGLLTTALAVIIIETALFSSPVTSALRWQSFVRLSIFTLVALLMGSLTAARKRAEDALRKARDELEVRVHERTKELAQTNEALRAEISERQRTEEEKQELLADLHERVKELTVLHQTARLLQDGQKPEPVLLQEITTLLPSAWQYPEITAARICFDSAAYATPNFSSTPWKQCASFTTSSGKSGTMEVVYVEEKPHMHEGPFLAEERHLLCSLTEMVQSYCERKEAEKRIAHITTELIDRNTELWRLQREMGRIEPLAALGQVVSTIAHELGTPLSSVLGYSQLLAKENLSAGARQSLQIIERQVERMENIIRNYLSRTRQSVQLSNQVQLAALIRETLLLLEPMFQQRGVQIFTQLADGLPQLRGEAAALQRVFINLLNNAVDAMEHGGTITITTRITSPSEPVSPGVCIEVCDTGSGIAPELLPRIFDLFITTKAPGQGTGLGLAVCQEIVKAHEGTIKLSSQLGTGTCVRILLPTENKADSVATGEGKL